MMQVLDQTSYPWEKSVCGGQSKVSFICQQSESDCYVNNECWANSNMHDCTRAFTKLMCLTGRLSGNLIFKRVTEI